MNKIYVQLLTLGWISFLSFFSVMGMDRLNNESNQMNSPLVQTMQKKKRVLHDSISKDFNQALECTAASGAMDILCGTATIGVSFVNSTAALILMGATLTGSSILGGAGIYYCIRGTCKVKQLRNLHKKSVIGGVEEAL